MSQLVTVDSLLTLREVAQVLRISYYRAAELARRKTLPGVVRLGKMVRIRKDSLAKFIEQGGVGLPRRDPREAA